MYASLNTFFKIPDHVMSLIHTEIHNFPHYGRVLPVTPGE